MGEPSALVLGPFELLEHVATGGVGEVWKAVHVLTRVPAAVKVLNAESARDPLARMALRAELRAVAALDHPNIVYVFGTGEITTATVSAIGPKLRPGAAWIAMEFAEGGTLRDRAGAMTWAAVRAALGDVLAGLAHAHARGFVHGDIKPANLLVGGVRPGVKIGDFGVAQHLDPAHPTRGREIGWGSPSYMAPEQIDPRLGALGPWTDLYSLGCTAWTLLTGSPPFAGTPEEVITLQLEAALPPFTPTCALPDGAEPWLRRLLVKDPARRVRAAADALRLLSRIPSEGSDAPTRPAAGRATPSETTQPIAPRQPRHVHPDPENQPPPGEALPPFPPRPLAPRSLPAMFAGTGLELLGLRALEVVGRDPEQDYLWARLRDVYETGRARVVIVHGPSGVGTTRLVRWLVESAGELGVARPVVAWYGGGAASVRGLRPAFTRALRLTPEDRATVGDSLAVAAPALDPADRAALGVWLTSASGRATPLLPRAERVALWRRVLTAMVQAPPPTGEGKPLVLWIDGAHQGSVEALALVRALDNAPIPVLILLTVTDELLAPTSLEAGLLADLRTLPSVEELRLLPLGELACRELLERQLGLDRAFADAVSHRTKGNPLFALQLVGECVQRKLLESGPRGVRLRRGVQLTLPEDLERVWAQRMDLAANGLSAAAAESIELLAVLGDPADRDEWTVACSEAGLDPSELLAERLESEGLISRTDGGGWRFVHAMFREALERRAARGGRLDRWHRACAGMLRRHQDRAVAERIGRHLLAAGDLGGSLGPLAIAIEDRILAREVNTATDLLEMREDALGRIGVMPEDARRGEQRLLQALLAQVAGDLAGAEAQANAVAEDVLVHGWSGVQARTLWLQGRIARRRGQSERSRDALGDAALAAASTGDLRTVARARADLGDVLVDLGDWEAARRSFLDAAPLFAVLDDAMGAGEVHLGLCLLDVKSGDLPAATDHADQAQGSFGRVGNRVGLARVYNLRGDIFRFQGRRSEAAEQYRAAAELLEAVSSWMAFVPQVNLGLLLLEEGRFDAARAQLEPQVAELRRWPSPEVEVCVELGLLVCGLALGDAERVAESRAVLGRILPPPDVRDSEVRGLLDQVAAQARARGEAEMLAWAEGRLDTFSR